VCSAGHEAHNVSRRSRYGHWNSACQLHTRRRARVEQATTRCLLHRDNPAEHFCLAGQAKDSRRTDDAGGFHVTASGRPLSWPEAPKFTVLPLTFSCLPVPMRSSLTTVHGSGQDGTLEVFSIRDDAVLHFPDFTGKVVSAFRGAIHCPSTTADPNVHGLAWSDDGSQIFAFAQSTIHESCGEQGTFRGVMLSMQTGAVEKFYSETISRRVFHALLPHNMR